MNNLRKMLLGTVAMGLLGSVGFPAFAGEVEKSMSISGHINRAVVVSNNGENTAVALVDSTQVSGSRFRINGTAKSSTMTISTSTELGVQANGSVGSHAADTTSINLRQSYIALSNNMGTLTIGHTGVADEGLADSSLSGTENAGFYGTSVIHGEELRISGDTSPASSGVLVGDVLEDLTTSRADTIKYETPDLRGFTATVGYAHTNHGAARLEYAADYNGTKVQAVAGWGSRGGTAAINSVWGGSVAVSLASGLNGSLAYTRRELNGNVTANAGRTNPGMYGASIGYATGANGITVWYMRVNDLDANNDKARSFAVVAQHDLADYGASVYGGIQNVDYSTTATKYDNTLGGWLGVKVTF